MCKSRKKYGRKQHRQQRLPQPRYPIALHKSMDVKEGRETTPFAFSSSSAKMRRLALGVSLYLPLRPLLISETWQALNAMRRSRREAAA